MDWRRTWARERTDEKAKGKGKGPQQGHHRGLKPAATSWPMVSTAGAEQADGKAMGMATAGPSPKARSYKFTQCLDRYELAERSWQPSGVDGEERDRVLLMGNWQALAALGSVSTVQDSWAPSFVPPCLCDFIFQAFSRAKIQPPSAAQRRHTNHKGGHEKRARPCVMSCFCAPCVTIEWQ